VAPVRCLGLAAAAALLLGGCDYLLGGGAPSWLGRISASAHLRSIVAQETGSELWSIDGFNYLESQGSSAALVFVTTTDFRRHLVALDGRTLGDPRVYSTPAYSLGTSAGVDMTGYYVTGQLSLRWDNRLPQPPPPFPSFSVDKAISDSTSNYSITGTTNTYDLIPYNAVWGAPGGPISRPIFSAGGGQHRFSGHTGMGSSPYVHLFYSTNNKTFMATQSPYVYPDTTPADAVTAIKTIEIHTGNSYNNAWATADGAVARESDNSGHIILKLYRFGAAGASDEYSLRENGDMQMSFEPSGRYWFLYEGTTGRLYKLRTWWK